MATTKEDAVHLEKAADAIPGSSLDSPGEALDDDPVYTYAEQRKIIHRVDRRLITVAGIIYMNSLMDRSNLPNAGIAGMNLDLNMIGMRYVGLRHDGMTFPARISLTPLPVYRCPRLLHHVHHPSASRNPSHAKVWSQTFSLHYLPRLGYNHGRLLLRHGVVGAHTIALGSRSSGSRLLPRSRLPYLNMVQSL